MELKRKELWLFFIKRKPEPGAGPQYDTWFLKYQ